MTIKFTPAKIFINQIEVWLENQKIGVTSYAYGHLLCHCLVSYEFATFTVSQSLSEMRDGGKRVIGFLCGT